MRIVIVGAGGFGREILDTIKFINKVEQTYEIVGFIDNVIQKGTLVNGIVVLGSDEILQSNINASLIIGFADPFNRKIFFEKYHNTFHFPVIIHPTAIISEYCEINDGSIIQAFSIIAANAFVGNCVVLNARSGIGHDSKIGSFTSIQSFCDITGNNVLGNLCFLGTGVKLIPNLKIADECYLCAGTVVFKDLAYKSKVIGNPGKIIN
jgi:sugar O-acyltransferase (sialic acid O-acetyltransferase NeuD family)